MKKLIVLSAVSLALLSACKKDRTCECTYTYTSSTSSSFSTSKTTYKKIKKADAKAICQKTTYVHLDDNGVDTDVNDCKLN